MQMCDIAFYLAQYSDQAETLTLIFCTHAHITTNTLHFIVTLWLTSFFMLTTDNILPWGHNFSHLATLLPHKSGSSSFLLLIASKSATKYCSFQYLCDQWCTKTLICNCHDLATSWPIYWLDEMWLKHGIFRYLQVFVTSIAALFSSSKHFLALSHN